MKQFLLLIFFFLTGIVFAQESTQAFDIQYNTMKAEGKNFIVTDIRASLPGVFLLTADDAIYDSESNVITVTRNVKIDYQTDQGLVEITAQEGVFDQINRNGSFTGVSVSFGDEFYFVGNTLEMEDDGQQFVITGGQITACNQAVAQWSVEIERARVQKEGYAFIKGAKFRVKNFPIFYFPYFIAPAMQKRRSGLLTPDSGRTERNGYFFSQPVYWAPRQDVDFTVTPIWYKDAGLRLDLEARYAPKIDINSLFQGRYIKDDVMADLIQANTAPNEDGEPLDEDRFRAFVDHSQPLLGGAFQVDVNAGSDFSVDRDYLQDASQTRVRDYYYRAALHRPVGRNLASIRVNRLERILSQNEEVQGVSKLPDFTFYQPNAHLGKGFYMRNYLYAGLFDLEDLGNEAVPLELVDQLGATSPVNDRLVRVGLDSEISRAQNWVRFLHTRWGVRYQGAYYQLDEWDEDAHRGGGFAFLETVGPRLQKSYGSGDRRLVHYIDAGLDFRMGSDREDPFLETITFDALDQRIKNLEDGFSTTWRINSRLFMGPKGAVRPLMDVEITQDADIDGEETKPIETRFRLLNLRGFQGHGLFEYNPDDGTFDTISMYSSVNRGSWTGYGGYVRRQPDSESFIGISQWQLSRWRSRFKIAMDYDVRNSEFKSQEFLYGYQGQCLGVNLGYVKSPFDSSRSSRDFFQLTINLRNLSELGTRF